MIELPVLDNLLVIDRIIGYPETGVVDITTVLEDLDTGGVSVKDRCGKALGPVFDNSKPVSLVGTAPAKTGLGADLVLFYTAECVFSNYHTAPMTVDGKKFLCSEQYFMWMKAKTFKDEETAELILNATRPAEAKNLGRQVLNFNDAVWKEASIRIMTIACYRKFQQNPALRKALFSTAKTVLVEGAPPDRIWGIGMGITDKRAADPRKWRGTNNLGRILTVIREHMMSSKKYDAELV